MGSYQVRVDHDRCASSGACILEEPDAFAYQEGEALAVALPPANDLPQDRQRELAELCPMDAIRLIDADGNDVTPE